MAVSCIKSPDQSNRVLMLRYNNASMAEIIADIPWNRFAFIENHNVDADKRPDGISSGVYFAIIPKVSLSDSMFAIVWSNINDPHVAGLK